MQPGFSHQKGLNGRYNKRISAHSSGRYGGVYSNITINLSENDPIKRLDEFCKQASFTYQMIWNKFKNGILISCAIYRDRDMRKDLKKNKKEIFNKNKKIFDVCHFADTRKIHHAKRTIAAKLIYSIGLSPHELFYGDIMRKEPYTQDTVSRRDSIDDGVGDDGITSNCESILAGCRSHKKRARKDMYKKVWDHVDDNDNDSDDNDSDEHDTDTTVSDGVSDIQTRAVAHDIIMSIFNDVKNNKGVGDVIRKMGAELTATSDVHSNIDYSELDDLLKNEIDDIKNQDITSNDPHLSPTITKYMDISQSLTSMNQPSSSTSSDNSTPGNDLPFKIFDIFGSLLGVMGNTSSKSNGQKSPFEILSGVNRMSDKGNSNIVIIDEVRDEVCDE